MFITWGFKETNRRADISQGQGQLPWRRTLNILMVAYMCQDGQRKGKTIQNDRSLWLNVALLLCSVVLVDVAL